MEQNGNWYATVTPDNQKLYNGKEFNRDWDINLNDHGARWYDPALGRFISVDPLAEIAPSWTPYRFGFDNPIKYSDPTGMVEHGQYGYEEYVGNVSIGIGLNGAITISGQDVHSAAAGDADAVNAAAALLGEAAAAALGGRVILNTSASGGCPDQPCNEYNHPPEGWQTSIYDAFPTEDGKWAWFYKGTGEPFYAAQNVFELLGRYAEVAMPSGKIAVPIWVTRLFSKGISDDALRIVKHHFGRGEVKEGIEHAIKHVKDPKINTRLIQLQGRLSTAFRDRHINGIIPYREYLDIETEVIGEVLKLINNK